MSNPTGTNVPARAFAFQRGDAVHVLTRSGKTQIGGIYVERVDRGGRLHPHHKVRTTDGELVTVPLARLKQAPAGQIDGTLVRLGATIAFRPVGTETWLVGTYRGRAGAGAPAKHVVTDSTGRMHYADDVRDPNGRPDWDDYFMVIATAVSLRMSCDRARIGALIVSPDHRILSGGYGGAPSGWPSCDEVGHQMVTIGDGTRQSCVRTVHAEENAVVTAARHGGGGLDGATLYTTAFTCYDCFKMVVQAGIKRIVYAEERYSARTADIDIKALAQERGIELVHHPVPRHWIERMLS